MQLFHKEYPGPGKPLIILHGLFGMLDNWHNIARTLSEEFHVFLPDLRNHGQSPHNTTMNYAVMAKDLLDFMEEKGLGKAAIMGHSMGGKVAMEFALQYPEKCSELIAVDMAPVEYEPGHNEIFDALFKLDITNPEKSRKELDEELTKGIPEFGVRQFLLKSLVRKEEGGYEWKFNLQGLFDSYDSILAPIAAGRSFEGPALFIRGERSGYVKDEYLPIIKELFPAMKLETVAEAGHWVHADKPAELMLAVKSFLEK